MPLTPEQHRRPKKEDLPPWPKGFDQQVLWMWTVYRRDIATAAASATSIITTVCGVYLYLLTAEALADGDAVPSRHDKDEYLNRS